MSGTPKHGKSNTRPYWVWHTLRKKHKADMPPAWADFRAFVADVGEPPPKKSLKRIDPTKPFSRDNCRWLTRSEWAVPPNYRHGKHRTKAHASWHRLIQRTTNRNCPDYPDYGGRGITPSRAAGKEPMNDPQTETPPAPAAGSAYSCPVCGASSFQTHTANNARIGPGFREWVLGYSCDGCSAAFLDPVRFGNAKRNRVCQMAHV